MYNLTFHAEIIFGLLAQSGAFEWPWGSGVSKFMRRIPMDMRSSCKGTFISSGLFCERTAQRRCHVCVLGSISTERYDAHVRRHPTSKDVSNCTPLATQSGSEQISNMIDGSVLDASTCVLWFRFAKICRCRFYQVDRPVLDCTWKKYFPHLSM